MKITKILAAAVAAAAVLSFAGCSNNNTSSTADSSSAAESNVSTAENTASTAETASTADAETASTADAATPATAQAETPAFDVSVMYGNWLLAAVNDGTTTMNVADYAASLNSDVESVMTYVTIDENGYTSKILDNSATSAYSVSDNGIVVDMDGIELPITYDAEGDCFAFGVSQDEVTYKYVFMRDTGDSASTAEAAPATAQTAATAEAAE